MIKYVEFIEEKPILHTAIDERGREVVDPRPVSIPLPVAPPASSMMELIHQLYRQMEAEKHYETFEDAENFDIPDELGIEMRNTPYEQDFDHIEPVAQPVGSPEKNPAVDNGGGEPVQE